jgi:hypothetical protein
VFSSSKGILSNFNQMLTSMNFVNAAKTPLLSIGLILLVIFSGHTQSETGISSILTRLKGDWKSNGTSFGSPSDITMIWQPTLQNAYMQIHYTIVMHTPKNGDQIFEGTGLYKQDSIHHYTAVWADSQRELHPITAIDDETTLTSVWGVAGKKLGKTLYRFADNDTVEVVDYIQKKDGSWKEFSRNTFKRKLQ